ncbi:MAG: hypothetical protein MJ252_06590, partial [archaeon]|nr:hypothetical protein [archaeon]
NEEDDLEELLNKLISNEETKKIIKEKLEELNQEVDHKITNRQSDLEAKLKEIEDFGKGGKKK